MRTTTRLPVVVPTLKGKPALCGVEVMVEIADYEAADVPTVCVFEDRYPHRHGPMPALKAYRYADGRFLKMHPMDRFGEPTTVSAAITGFAVVDIVGTTLTKVRRNVGPDVLAQAYLEAPANPGGYEVLYAAVKTLPSLESLRKGMVAPVAANEAVERALARASAFCRINGICHLECGEPAIINLYSPSGVRRFAGEMINPLDMPKGNSHWTMFPATEYGSAVAEPQMLDGWLSTNAVTEIIRRPQIRSPEMFGSDFLERETVRHLRCLPDAINQVTVRSPRHRTSKKLRVAMDAFVGELNSDRILQDPGAAVEAARQIVDIVGTTTDLELWWPGLALFERTFVRWDDRPVRMNEIVPAAPRAK